MKKGLLLFVVGGLLAFGSCTTLEDIKDFAIPRTFEQSVTLAVSATDTLVFEEEMVIDASGDQEIKDNVSNISGFNLNKVAYKVNSFTGDEAIIAEGMLQFFNAEGNIGDPIDIGDMEFKALTDSGEEVEIAVSDDLKADLEKKLLSDQAFSMRLYGVVSDKPMSADIVMLVTVEAKVKF